MADEATPNPLAGLLRSHPETAFDYLEFRLVVAGMAARLAAERATEDDRRRLAKAHQALLDAHQADDPEAEAEADAEFHLVTYAATHNAVMAHVMDRIFLLLRDDVFYRRGQLYRRDGVRDLLLRQHQAIFDAIMARDAEAARLASERHILYIREALRESRLADERLAVARRRAGLDSLAQVAEKQG